jgi:hypothetical protein
MITFVFKNKNLIGMDKLLVLGRGELENCELVKGLLIRLTAMQISNGTVCDEENGNLKL